MCYTLFIYARRSAARQEDAVGKIITRPLFTMLSRSERDTARAGEALARALPFLPQNIGTVLPAAARVGERGASPGKSEEPPLPLTDRSPSPGIAADISAPGEGSALSDTDLAAANLRAFVALYGEMGAGKTAFVRGMARLLAPGAAVCSPTYTLVNEYPRARAALPPLRHLDLYRIEGEDDLASIGFFDFVCEGVVVAEWCERIPEDLPLPRIKVRIETLGDPAAAGEAPLSRYTGIEEADEVSPDRPSDDPAGALPRRITALYLSPEGEP